MTIEVKQLIIKSTVTNNHQSYERAENVAVDVEKIKELVLKECRELIAEQLDERRER